MFKTSITLASVFLAAAIPATANAADACPNLNAELGASISVSVQGTEQATGTAVAYSFVGCNRSPGDRYTLQVTRDYKDAGVLVKQPVTELATYPRGGATGTFSANGSFIPPTAGRYVVRAVYYREGQIPFEADAEAVMRIAEPVPPVIINTVPTPEVPVEPTPEPIGESTPTPKLTIKKKAVRKTVRAGKTAAFRIRVANPSQADARNVVICDAIPGKTQYLSSSRKVTFDKGRACIKLNTLAAGKSVSFTIKLRVDRNIRTSRIKNCATTSADTLNATKSCATVKVPRSTPRRIKAPVTG